MTIQTIAQIIRGRTLIKVQPDDTIRAACKLMSDQYIGAVAVVDGTHLVGVLSERDVVRRVVARDLSVDDTLVRQATTAAPQTVNLETGLDRALVLMLDGGFRHLPVMDGDTVIGMISLRDIPPGGRGRGEGGVEADKSTSRA